MDKIYKALADNSRRRILKLLKDKDLSVSQILTDFSFTQATLSSHLAVLRKAGLVSVRVEGKRRIYRLAGEGIMRVIEDLSGGSKSGGRRVNL